CSQGREKTEQDADNQIHRNQGAAQQDQQNQKNAADHQKLDAHTVVVGHFPQVVNAGGQAEEKQLPVLEFLGQFLARDLFDSLQEAQGRARQRILVQYELQLGHVNLADIMIDGLLVHGLSAFF